MKIRDYRESDYDKLRPLIDAFHRETEDNPESLKDFYNKGNLKRDYITLVAEEDHSIVGFIIGQALNKNDFLLLDAYVDINYRRRGIALKLSEVLLDKVKGNYKRLLANPIKKESLRLLVDKFNFKALPEKEKNTPRNGKPPYYTYFLML
ncbi:MAG: GNAT family N-acetyltransferase [Candidatus Nanoarchaeia archaeon]|jgi:ribosomal protein S18 acetylase RimI-like enzyme